MPSIRFLLFCFALLVVAAMPWLRASATEDPTGRLVVITNFDSTEVQVDGESYPYEWVDGESIGVDITAGRTHTVVVSSSPEQRRTYRLRLDPGETRVLVVDIENMGRVAPPPSPTATGAGTGAAAGDDEEEEEDGEPADDVGYLSVSASPRGIVNVDGTSTGERTPARRIELEPGRHEVTIWYDEEDITSEVKHVLIRAGVNTNVFFRLRREQLEAGVLGGQPEDPAQE